ncbi:phosphate ABC transporter permease subunit PstC [Acaryochloris sp. IP29b_bin.148]|uniref:phosphate ABC transporter permease subunit PstC n=1 Tax=Acaryochloris sp. IP29b_bin.148 TaxID=2969218 RepID=UPI0026153837|nr:phosphate ABC transporter permease subunit PstC [Acaryochloris sp. IP29b_bin.148]
MSRFKNEATWRVLLRILALCSGAILLLILGFLVWETLPILRTVSLDRFWRDPGWHPSEQAYNLTPMVIGTLGVTVGAVLVATPLGLLSAVFCQYYAPAGVAQLYRRLIELLAGIPSVVYGLWGLVVLVPLIAKVQPPGSSLLAGILILALMILPTIALVIDASLASLPPSYWRGSAALGLGTWATVQGVCLPAIRSGLLTAVMLATARALGETMAVLMVCGNVVQVPDSIFAPVRTLTANIALEMAYALDLHRSALFASGLVLMLVVTGLVVVTDPWTDAPEG